MSRVLRSAGDRFSIRINPRVARTIVISLGVAALGAIASLMFGNAPLSPARVVEILLGDYSRASGFEVFTVLDVRLPRLICALLAGLALGISGALFQQLTENPLGSPDIIGFTAGASTGAVAAIALGGAVSIGAGALLGALAAAALIYLLAWRSGLDGFRLILVGIGVSAVLGAVRTYLLSRADLAEAQAGYRWLVGGLSGRNWDDVQTIVVGAVVLIPATILLHRPADRLSVGHDLATSQGLNVGRWRIVMALVGTGWVAVAVLVAGPIGFVALAAPHVARLLGAGSGPHFATSGLVGAALLILADVISLRALAPTQLPTGVVTGILGGLYLLWLLQSRQRGRTS